MRKNQGSAERLKPQRLRRSSRNSGISKANSKRPHRGGRLVYHLGGISFTKEKRSNSCLMFLSMKGKKKKGKKEKRDIGKNTSHHENKNTYIERGLEAVPYKEGKTRRAKRRTTQRRKMKTKKGGPNKKHSPISLKNKCLHPREKIGKCLRGKRPTARAGDKGAGQGVRCRSQRWTSSASNSGSLWQNQLNTNSQQRSGRERVWRGRKI